MRSVIILVLDGSKQAESAIPYAEVLCRRTKAELLLLSVVHSKAGTGETLDELRADHERYLEEIRSGLSHLSVSAEIRVGRAATEIATAIGEVERPLLLVAGNGYGKQAGYRPDSELAWVNQLTQCPLLVIPSGAIAPAAEASVNWPQHVLFVGDNLRDSEQSIRSTLELVDCPRPRIHLLWAAPEPTWTRRSLNHGLLRANLAQTREGARAQLERLGNQLMARGYPATWEFSEAGTVVEQIKRSAKATETGLIIYQGQIETGRIKRKRFDAKLLRQIDRPVLLVNPNRPPLRGDHHLPPTLEIQSARDEYRSTAGSPQPMRKP